MRNEIVLSLVFILVVSCLLLSGAIYYGQKVANERIAEENQVKLNNILQSSYGCYAPCWKGLVPGYSTVTDYNLFASMAVYNGYHFHSENVSNNTVTYRWENEENGLVVFIKFTNGVLSVIEFAKVEFANIQMILEALGQPTSYTARYIRDFESSYISMIFYYEEIGAVIPLVGIEMDHMRTPCKLETEAEYPLLSIFFVVPNNSHQMFGDTIGDPFSLEDHIQRWNGVNSIIISGC